MDGCAGIVSGIDSEQLCRCASEDRAENFFAGAFVLAFFDLRQILAHGQFDEVLDLNVVYPWLVQFKSTFNRASELLELHAISCTVR